MISRLPPERQEAIARKLAEAAPAIPAAAARGSVEQVVAQIPAKSPASASATPPAARHEPSPGTPAAPGPTVRARAEVAGGRQHRLVDPVPLDASLARAIRDGSAGSLLPVPYRRQKAVTPGAIALGFAIGLGIGVGLTAAGSMIRQALAPVPPAVLAAGGLTPAAPVAGSATGADAGPGPAADSGAAPSTLGVAPAADSAWGSAAATVPATADLTASGSPPAAIPAPAASGTDAGMAVPAFPDPAFPDPAFPGPASPGQSSPVVQQSVGLPAGVAVGPSSTALPAADTGPGRRAAMRALAAPPDPAAAAGRDGFSLARADLPPLPPVLSFPEGIVPPADDPAAADAPSLDASVPVPPLYAAFPQPDPAIAEPGLDAARTPAAPPAAPPAGKASPAFPGVSLSLMVPEGAGRAEVAAASERLAAEGFDPGDPRAVEFLIRRTHVRFYFEADRSAAEAAARSVGGEARDFSRSAGRKQPGRIEVWLASPGVAEARVGAAAVRKKARAPAGAGPARAPAETDLARALEARIIAKLKAVGN